MIIKQGNTNSIDTHTWRSLLFELLLNKQILRKVLKDIKLPEDCTIHLFKRDNVLSKKLKTYFDVLIRVVDNDTKKMEEIYILLGNFKIKPEYSDTICISIYRSKKYTSLENLIYSSTSKRAKIIFSFLRSCDKRKIFVMHVSDEELIKLPFFTLNNLELPIEKFLEIVYKKMGLRNKIQRQIIKSLWEDKECVKAVIKYNLKIDYQKLDQSVNRMLKKLPYLKRFLEIDNKYIKLT